MYRAKKDGGSSLFAYINPFIRQRLLQQAGYFYELLLTNETGPALMGWKHPWDH